MPLSRPLIGLTLLYSFIFVFSAIAPHSRAVWFAEIIPAILILGGFGGYLYAGHSAPQPMF